MKFSKQKLSILTGNAIKLINSPLKKTVITTVTIAALAFHPNPVALANDTEHTTVSSSNIDIGTIPDKNIINRIVDQKITTNEPSYKDMNLQLVSIMSKLPFQTTAGNTSFNLVNAAQLTAKATAIVIDGKPIVYLENNNIAQDVLKKLELKYVTEAQLKDFETRSAKPESVLPPLKNNESRIADIHLSKKVSIVEENVTPKKILSADQAVNLLQSGTLEQMKYVVKDGDVLGTIANSHQLKLADLLSLNPGLTENSILKIGQELNITMPKPFVDVIVEKEINQQEELPYQTVTKEDSSMAKGDSKVSQAGQNGLENADYQISEINGIAVQKVMVKQDILKQPVNCVVIEGTKVIPSRGSGSFSWPAVGGYISSQMGYRWGKLHKGIDIAGPSNRTIKAADNGVVTFAGWDNGGYGNKIIINHQNGFTTLYGHLASIGVRAGQTVQKGEAIGVMGETGDAEGIHLHFEVHQNGALVNPLNYVSR